PSRTHPFTMLFPYTTLFRSACPGSSVKSPSVFKGRDCSKQPRRGQPGRGGGAAIVHPPDVICPGGSGSARAGSFGSHRETGPNRDRKSTRLNSSHVKISYAV